MHQAMAGRGSGGIKGQEETQSKAAIDNRRRK